jgi:thiol-disulfide isomerase/thioredoxin
MNMSQRNHRSPIFTRVLRVTMLAGATALLLGACAGEEPDAPPVCGDGKVNGDDQCDGDAFADASCATAGFDEGQVGCTSECTLEVSQCVILDEDFDQLNIYDEAAFGTDPLNPDSDGDGILDGLEVQNASDPLNAYSWPQGLGMWPNRLAAAAADGVVGSGWGSGQTVWNIGWLDQFGQIVQLHQLYGYVVVLSIGARWCGPCQEAASTSQQLWNEWREQGVIFVEAIIEGVQPGVDATPDDISAWTNNYALQYPVVWSEQPVTASSLPTYWIFNRNLSAVQKIEGFGGDPMIATAIQNAM